MSPAEIGPFRCKCTCAFPHRFPRAAGHTQRTVSWFTRVERKTRPRASKRSWWREGGAEDASRLADTYFDVNKPDRDGVTPIVHAVRSHDLSLMRALYDRGAALDWKRPEMPSHWRPRGLTPLLAAVEMRAADIASELLDRGADPEAPGPDSATPLQLAVLPSGPVEMEAFSALLCSLRETSPGADLSACVAEAKRGDANEACLAALDRAVDEAVAALSPLHQTVVRKNVELVELLLVRGAKPGTGAGRGMELRDPLLVASVRGGMATSVALLLRHGANVRARGAGLESALGEACREGLAVVALALIAKGADRNADDRAGMTPLAHALERGDRATLEILLEMGADARAPMPRAHGGGSLLHFALNHGLASRPADLQRLIDAGCSIDATDAAGETPLLCALLSGLPDAAQALLNLGADPRASTGTGVSALHLACDRGYLDLAKELLARGADARAVDAKGRSCLWYAKASPGKAKEALVALLLSHGAVEMPNDKPMSPTNPPESVW